MEIFSPGPDDRPAIDALKRFCSRRGSRSFQAAELFALPDVRTNPLVSTRLRRWLSDENERVVLGELVLHRLPDGWDCEVTTPGSPYYLSLRILPQARALFRDHELLPVDHAGFIGVVHELRSEILAGKSLVVRPGFTPKPLPPELLAFVTEHLNRCGLGGLRPDVRSISELCDIFDEYEFHSPRR